MKTGFDGDALLHALPWTAGTVAVLVGGTFVASRIAHRHNVVDTAWGLFFAGVGVTSFVCSAGHGDVLRRVLLLVLPLLWGVRLAVHVGRRSIGKGEDPRYAALVGKAKGNPDLYALRMVYLLQAILAFLISAPIQVGSFEHGPVRVVGWIGVALWCVGVFFEGVGDSQMERWRGQPEHKGKVIDVGLWRYTRHPNYFGDACVWWGIFLVAAERWPGVLTILAPVVMTLLLTKGSGARILEAHMSKREGWDEYAARTSGFIPLPPRKRAAAKARR